jgi:hypothetical protein
VTDELEPWARPGEAGRSTEPRGEPTSEGGGDTADPASLELRELMARAMAAQGKVDPALVFAEAEHVDLDDWPSGTAPWDERDDPGPDERPPIQSDIFDEGAELDAERPEWA